MPVILSEEQLNTRSYSLPSVPSSLFHGSWLSSCWPEIRPCQLSPRPPPAHAEPSWIWPCAHWPAPPGEQLFSVWWRSDTSLYLWIYLCRQWFTHSFFSLSLVGFHLALEFVHQILQPNVVFLVFLGLKTQDEHLLQTGETRKDKYPFSFS